MVEAEFAQIWQRVEQDLKAGNLDEDDKGKDEETLKAEYRGISERRIRLGLLLSEIGRTNNITVTGDELARAMRQEAGRYPGQEQQVMEFFRKNPQAAENLRSPIFEEKVVDFMLELAQVTDRQVSPEELTAPDAAAPSGGSRIGTGTSGVLNPPFGGDFRPPRACPTLVAAVPACRAAWLPGSPGPAPLLHRQVRGAEE